MIESWPMFHLDSLHQILNKLKGLDNIILKCEVNRKDWNVEVRVSNNNSNLNNNPIIRVFLIIIQY